MVGHLANEAVWGGVATQYGAHAIDVILRKELGFVGVVLSDDLAMRAIIRDDEPVSDAVRSAIKAGVDIVIVGRFREFDQTTDVGRKANEAIVDGLCSGELSRTAIEGSVDRIRTLKLRRLK